MRNPTHYKLLTDFVTHLERRGSRNGWQIISKGSYDNRTNYTKTSTTRPPKTERKVMRMFWEWYEMGNDDLEYEVESFLKTWSDN
tara:strand:- start:23 stop:277 length:255 start_codon:yes stop_codon:yes gene_type:complete